MANLEGIGASVLMPTYNNSPFLKEAIESILNQSFRDFEFIIINDGSNDGSDMILKRYAGQDHRIRIIEHEKNMGIVASLNRGLRECRGKYVVRMDSDDIAMAERIEKQIHLMEKDRDIVALGTSLAYIDAQGRELGVVRGSNPQQSLLAKSPLLHPTVVIRRDVLQENRLEYQERYRYAEDYYLWLQLSKLGRLHALDDVLLKYRISSGASRIRHLKAMLRATLRVKRDGVRNLGFKPQISDRLRFLFECTLIVVPTSLVLWCYQIAILGKTCVRWRR